MHQTVDLRGTAKLQIFFQINSHVVNRSKNRFYFCIFAYSPFRTFTITISFENAHHLIIKSFSTRYFSSLIVRILTFAKMTKKRFLIDIKIRCTQMHVINVCCNPRTANILFQEVFNIVFAD